MTKLFQQAIGKASRLPDADQDTIARLVLDEIESDRRWAKIVAESPQQLTELADAAWAEHEADAKDGTGSQKLDPDNL